MNECSLKDYSQGGPEKGISRFLRDSATALTTSRQTDVGLKKTSFDGLAENTS